MDFSNAISSDNVNDLVGYVNSIDLPPAVKKSLWKAVGDLVAGAVDVPVAYLESKSQQIRTEAQALSFVTKKAAEAAAKKFEADEQLVERTVSHFGQKLFKEQINRERIIAKAIGELGNDPPAQDSESEIDEDWLSMFSRIAEQKSNSDVQLFLAKILAGEIRKPGSYSPQTIHILSTLSQNVAQLFQIFCESSFLQVGGTAFLITDPFGDAGSNGLSPLGLSYSQLTILQDAGLIQHDLNAWREINAYVYAMPFEIGGQRYQLGIAPNTMPSDLVTKKGRVTTINFTDSGLQLRSVLHLGENSVYKTKFFEWLYTQYNFLAMP